MNELKIWIVLKKINELKSTIVLRSMNELKCLIALHVPNELSVLIVLFVVNELLEKIVLREKNVFMKKKERRLYMEAMENKNPTIKQRVDELKILTAVKLGIRLSIAFLTKNKKEIKNFKHAFHYIKYKYRKVFPFILDTFTRKAYGASKLTPQQLNEYINSLNRDINVYSEMYKKSHDAMIQELAKGIKIGSQAILSNKHLADNQ